MRASRPAAPAAKSHRANMRRESRADKGLRERTETLLAPAASPFHISVNRSRNHRRL